MSIFNDYTHEILHHQTERELIEQAEQNRLAREARGIKPHQPWWQRLVRRGERKTSGQPRPVTRLAH
jgi:hypothetical protein